MTRRLACLSLAATGASAYPLDGYESTGIRRLLGYQKMKLPPGALRKSAEIKLHLQGSSFDIGSTRDPRLQAGLERIFAGRNASYGIALTDITDPASPKYAAIRPDEKRIPGSVGKLLVATGLFQALADTYQNTSERAQKLSKTVLLGDSFVHRDGKTVPFFQPGDTRVVNRRLEIGDSFNLYEWTDHMLSQSSNAAASFVWKQVMLLREFGARYPVPKEEEAAFFKNTPKPKLGEKALAAVEAPLKACGLDTTRLRIGTMFTSSASAVVPGTASYACPGELMRWLIKLEQGKLVDAWSSLELKKLIYFARPRYRYASAPALANAAVFFKSGSLFECAPGTKCGAYKGTAVNLMHSVAIVESKRTYLVAMMSNVLGVNSAVEHQTIAGEIERLMVSL